MEEGYGLLFCFGRKDHVTVISNECAFLAPMFHLITIRIASTSVGQLAHI